MTLVRRIAVLTLLSAALFSVAFGAVQSPIEGPSFWALAFVAFGLLWGIDHAGPQVRGGVMAAACGLFALIDGALVGSVFVSEQTQTPWVGLAVFPLFIVFVWVPTINRIKDGDASWQLAGYAMIDISITFVLFLRVLS